MQDPPLSSPLISDTGIHYNAIKSHVPDAFYHLSPHVVKHLNTVPRETPTWYLNASEHERAQLREHHALGLKALTAVQQIEANIRDIESFAAPLLTQAIKDTWNYDADVTADKLDIVLRATLIPTEVGRHTQTLLQAALHNFPVSEARGGGMALGSRLYHDRTGRRQFEPPTLPIDATEFAALVRKLDVGGRYQAHLNDVLNPNNPVEKKRLEALFVQHEQCALKVHADIALMKKDISPNLYESLILLSTPGTSIPPHVPSITYHYMQIGTITLSSFIAFVSGPRDDVQRCITYIPGDPVSCIKEYASRREAHAGLLAKLEREDYRSLFIQLAPQRQKLALKKRLDGRFKNGNNDPLKMIDVHIEGDLFQLLYTQKMTKLYDDALFIAVPTDTLNRLERIDRLEHYVDVALNTLNVEALFIPGLGEVMMGVFAAQMMNDSFHALESWESGDKQEAWGYVKGVLINLAATAALAGTVVGTRVVDSTVARLLDVKPIELSPFVEELDSVELPNGQSTLWNPDLKPYEHSVSFEENATPNEQGLLHHNGKNYLQLEGQTFNIEPSLEGTYHLEHPTAPYAYRPPLIHNGHNAWRLVTEDISQWDKETLLRRLDTSLTGLSDKHVQDLLHSSNMSEDVLRQVHIDGLQPPALLEDCITRLKVHQHLQRFIEAMRAGNLMADPQIQLQLLIEEKTWPATKALRFVNSRGDTVAEYGNVHETKVPVVQVLDVQLRNGNLLKTVLQSLDEPEVRDLLGESPAIGDSSHSLEERVNTLRHLIAKRAVQRMGELFSSHYPPTQFTRDPLLQHVMSAYPPLPKAVAQEVLNATTSTEYALIQSQTGPLPLRVAEEARLYAEEVRLARAYEGVRFNHGDYPDTQKLILHSLERMPGWSDQVTIEVRDQDLRGAVIDRIGASDAPIRKILVKQGKDYQAFNALEEELHGFDDLYASVLHALPDEQRAALGFSSTGQGLALQDALLKQPLMPREALRKVLDMPKQLHPSSPMKLANGREGYPLLAPEPSRCGRAPINCFGINRRKVRRLLAELYPTHTEEAALEFLGIDEVRTHADLEIINHRKREFRTLKRTLTEWVSEPPELISLPGRRFHSIRQIDKERVAHKIMKCWQRKTQRLVAGNGSLLGYQLHIDGINIGRLPALTADFSHVSSLRLKNLYMGENIDPFLNCFSALRWLDLESGHLTELPSAIGNMPELTKLILANNRLTLTPRTASYLERCTKLKILRLEDNPLGVLPRFSFLSELRILKLRNTGLTYCPEELGELPHLHQLDVRRNQITTVPAFYFTASLERIRNISFHGNPLNAASRQAVDELRALNGLPIEARIHAPVTNTPLRLWLEPGMSVGEETEKEAIWDALINEPGHEEFFKVINDLVTSPDFRGAKHLLNERVWKVLKAAADDSDFREQVFAAAVENTTCVDRATTLFSGIGMRYLLREAYLLEGQAQERALLALLKGRVRLQELRDIAQTQIDLQQHRYENAKVEGVLPFNELQRLKPDPIEVQMIYPVDLAERLNLPWQPTDMAFRALAKITPPEIDSAYNLILNKEKVPGYLSQKLVEDDIWTAYLNKNYAKEITHKNNQLLEQHENIETLREKQHAWAEDIEKVNGRNEARSQRELELKVLAEKLGVEEDKVFTGEPMLDQDYYDALDDIATQRKNLLKTLTQHILDTYTPSERLRP